VELRQYVALLRKWAWLLVLCAVLAAVPAYVLTKRQPPQYQATTTLLVSQASSTSIEDYNALVAGARLATTYAQLLTKRPVLEEVARRLNLPLSPSALAGMATVSVVRDTQLLTLRVVDTDPARAKDVANTLPVVFTEQNEAIQLNRYTSSKENLQKQLELVDTDIKSTQASLDTLQASPTPDALEISRLESALVQYRTTYADLLRSYEDIRLAEAKALDTVTVVEPAVLAPLGRKTMTNTVLAAVVGVMLAVGVAFLIEYLDDTVKSPRDVERSTNLPTFGVVVHFPRTEVEAGPVMAVDPKSAVAEGYRVLRTNVQFATMSIGKSGVVLLVTSAQPLEGKTTSLANLGVSLAQAGKRVLLVDSDLRRPCLHKHFNLSKEAGLTSLLLEHEADIERVIQKTAVDGLRVLTSGHVPANPAEVLSFAETGALLERLRGMADYVLLDSPPVLSVADASVLAQKADGVLMVVEGEHTRTEMFTRAVAALEGVKARVLGAILNNVGVRRSGYYYDYYYYYYSAYYSEEEGGGRKKKERHTRGGPLRRLGRAISRLIRGKPRVHAPGAPALEAEGQPPAEEAIAESTAEADTIYAKAMEHYRNRQWREARDALQRLKAMDPGRRGLDALLKDVERMMQRERSRQGAAAQGPKAVRRPRVRLGQVLLAIFILLSATAGVLMYVGVLPVPIVGALFHGNEVQTYINRGYDFFIVDNYEQAIDSFNKALELDPDNVEAKLGLQHATHYLELGQLYAEARVLMGQNSFDAAAAKLQTIIETDPWYKDARLLLSQAQSSQQLEALYSQAMDYYNAGDWAKAASALEALQGKGVSAGETEVRSKLLDSYLNEGQQEIAAADSRSAIIRATLSFNSALALSPNDVAAQEERQLGSLYLDGYTAYERADWAQAVANLSRIYATRQDYAQGRVAQLLCTSYTKLGDAYQAKGQLQLALDQYRLVEAIAQCDQTEALTKTQQILLLLATATPTAAATP
jgi:capsular exopolysaccharide synthesis family protein